MSSGIDDSSYIMSEVFTVNVNWNSVNCKWNVNAYALDDNRWNAGNRAVSSNSKSFSQLTMSWEFLIVTPSSIRQASYQLHQVLLIESHIF
jgi:hypothetical protein